MRELLQRRPSIDPAACKWRDVEILLKAAIFSDERQLLMEWVLSYVRNMDCFPRLHVVSDRPENSSSFRGLLRRVPNVTFHTLAYPFEMDEFWAMQWPMLWADNFTSARHIMVFDADTPLVLPLRCPFDSSTSGRCRCGGAGRPTWRGRAHGSCGMADRREPRLPSTTFFRVIRAS